MTLPEFIIDGSSKAKWTLALAHGAGAPMDSVYMQAFAEGLAGRGFKVARFEFPYMNERRQTGKKKPPNRAPVLLETWAAVIDHFGPEKLFIGGKSMGGRMASMSAADYEEEGTPVKGAVCLGYPFHPPGKPEKLRTEHLISLKTPTLICQGTRDPFGTEADAAAYTLSKSIDFHWLADGDHGFKPRKASGLTEQENWESAMDAILNFASHLPE